MHGGNLPTHYWQPPSSDDDTADPHLTSGSGWYFWDESELAVGPFPDFESAEEARKNYRP